MAQKFTVPITVKQLASAGSDAVTVYVDQDTFSRLKVEAGGRLTWGSGASAGDVNLYRASADVLQTDDTFKTPTLFVDNIEVDTTGATTNQALVFNGVKFVPSDVAASGGASLTVSDTAPASPSVGDLWFNSSNARTYVYYDSSWVEVGGSGGVATLDEIGDITAPSPTSGDFLKWNGTAWVNDAIDLGTDTTGNYVSGVSSGTGISVSHTPSEGSTATVSLNATLDNLSNVTVPSPTTNDVLQWNGTAWVNVAASTVGATTLDGLSDVVITTPEEFQSITYNGTNWVNNYASTVTYVRNAESTTLTTGTVVYLFGATGDHATVKRADNNSDVTSSKTVGLVGAPITASNNGPVVTRGYVDGIDLSVGYASGDVLWLGENGAFTKTKPTAPDHLVFVGVVVRATNNGIVYVATQNGYELDELHDVSIVDKTSGDFLKYNGTLWVNDQINLGTDTVGNYMSGVSVQNGLTVSHTPGEGSSATIGVDNALLSNFLLDGASGNSYGLIGTSAYLDVKNTNGYNKEIELDIVALETKLDTDGYITSTAHGSIDHSAVMASVVLDDIYDVNTSGASAGNVLTYNGSLWTAASAASGGSTVTASTTPPASPTSGSIWFDSSTAKTYVYYDSFWVEIGGTSGGAKMYVSQTAPSTPLEGQLWFKSDTAQTFAYYDSFWVEIGAAGMAAIAADAAPASPVTGQLWFNTSTGATYVYYDSYWIEVGAVAANTVFNLVDAKGDLLLGTADNTLARQAVGTNGQLLQANSATSTGVQWVTPTYAPAASPTFTGTVVLPSDTSIGTVTSTEIGYVDGVTSAIQTQLDSKLTTTTAVTSNRNVLINGALDIWQRGTTVTASGVFAADRFIVGRSGGATGSTFTRVSPGDSTNLPQFRYAIRCQRDSGNTGTAGLTFGQVIETANSVPLAGKQVTLSFYARAGANFTGTYLYSYVFTGTGTDQNGILSSWTGSANPVQGSHALTTTWARYSATGTLSSTTNEIFINLANSPTGTAGANDWYEVTGIQLEVGAVATPFEFEDIGETFAKCQRYFQKSYPLDIAPGATGIQGGIVVGGGQSVPNLGLIANPRFPVAMRTGPVITIYSYTSSQVNKVSDAYTGTDYSGTVTSVYTGPNAFMLYNTSGVTLTSSLGQMFHYTANAEM